MLYNRDVEIANVLLPVLHPVNEIGTSAQIQTDIGLRLRLTSHAQMKFDWGVPLSFPSEFEDSENDPVETSGRYHLSAQIQF